MRAVSQQIVDYASCDGIELANRIARGDMTSRQALDAAFTIIEAMNDELNAFVSLQSEQAYECSAGPLSGPLAGVPVAMKDCVGFVKGVKRDFGSRLALGTEIDFDDEVVSRMKRSGMIPMGTTNVPEFSSSVTTESVLHGPCHNPWDLSHSPGGSSGGSAVAVACGAVPIAYGNDAAGSIRVPASCCGLFGFKPSRGRVPTGPVYGEFWFGLMVHHVITRTVRDSALVLDVTEGIDAGAPYGIPDKTRDFLLETLDDPRPLRIAVSDGHEQGFTIAQECKNALYESANLLAELGHEVEEVAPAYSGSELLDNVTTVLAVALSAEIPDTAQEMGRSIGPDTVETCHRLLMDRGRGVTGSELARILDYRNRMGRTLGRFFEDYDVLITPTLAEPPIQLGVLNADSIDLDDYLERLWRYCPFTPLANVTGTPSMSVPLCWSESGLPVGIMATGRYADEATLLALAGQLERARPWSDRHPPFSVWNRSA